MSFPASSAHSHAPPLTVVSGAGDVRIWSTSTLQPVYIIHPCDDTSGDIFSLAWDSRGGGTLYFGSQSTAIEWINFSGSARASRGAALTSNANASGSSSGSSRSPQRANGSQSADSSRPHAHSRTRKPSLPTQSASVTVPIKPDSPKPPKLPHHQTGLDAVLPDNKSERSGRYRPHSFFDNASPSRSGLSTPSCYSPGYRKDYSDSPDASRQGLSRTGSAYAAARLRQDRSSDGSRRNSVIHALEAQAEGSGAEEAVDDGPDVGELMIGQDDGPSEVVELEIDTSARIAFAHFGYVYALETFHWPDGRVWLISASGDSDIKIWLLPPPESAPASAASAPPTSTPKLIKTFPGLSGAVLSLCVRPETALLFAGLQDGEILVFDLESLACVRAIDAHSADVLGLVSAGGERGDLYSTAADGTVLRVNDRFECTAAWEGHKGAGFAVAVIKAVEEVEEDGEAREEEKGKEGKMGTKEAWELLTAGNDSLVKVSSPDPMRRGETKAHGSALVDRYPVAGSRQSGRARSRRARRAGERGRRVVIRVVAAHCGAYGQRRRSPREVSHSFTFVGVQLTR